VHDVTWRIEWASCVKLSDRDRQVASRAYDDAQSAICQIPYRLGIVTTAAWTGSCYEDMHRWRGLTCRARKVGEDGGEHMTTYGKNREHCDAAGKIGRALQRFMGWTDE
jgi:hypothetical protein